MTTVPNLLISLLYRPKYELPVKVRARLLTTIPDSTSQKFVLIGSLSRKDTKPEGKHVVVFLDFAGMRDRQCEDGDFEKWYARGKGGHECIMGHKVCLVHICGTEAGIENLVDGSNGTTGESKTRIVMLVTNSRTPWYMRSTAHAKSLTTNGTSCSFQRPACMQGLLCRYQCFQLHP
jgi:hypothetical protein